MTTQSVISMPANDATFEQNVAILFRGILGDPNTKRVAKSGKNQKGIDVVGRRNRDAKQTVGIQCKLRTTNRKLTDGEARAELKKALAFTPALTEFFIVTTADDDITYDEIAATLSQEQVVAGRCIDIQIWGWNTLQDRIGEDQKALDAFDPGHSPMTERLAEIGDEQLAHSERSHAKLDQSLSIQHESHALLQDLAGDTAKGEQLLTHWDTQIDSYRDMRNDGRVKTAFELLTKLQDALTASDEPRVRARVRANIGLAHQRLGDDKRAGECLLEAYAIYPDDERIATNRILGLQLLLRFEDSLDVAKAHLEENPDDEHAAGFVFQAAMFLGDEVDPYEIISTRLLKRTLVRVYECHFLRHRDRRQEFIERALQTWKDDPDDKDARRIAADALLEKRVGDGQFRESPLRDPESREDLETAERLLTEFWDKTHIYDNAHQDPYLTSGCNLVTLYRALQRPADARNVAIQLLQIAPADRRVLTVAAHAALDREQMEDAEEHALGLPESAEKTSLLLNIWSASGEWQKIFEYATAERRDDMEGELLEQFDTMVFRAKFLSDDPVATDDDADALLSAWPTSLPVHIMVADFLSLRSPDRFEEVFGIARSLAQGDILYEHRLMFANLCQLTDKWGELIDVLAGYIATDIDTPPLSWLAMAYANADRAQGTSAFFRSLPDAIIEQNGYARLAAGAQYNRGELREAERYARMAIAARPSDLRSHLMLHGVLHRRNDMRAAGRHVANLDPSQLDGHVLERLRLAQILRQDVDAERGLALGFELAAHNRDVREIAVAWPGFIFFDQNLPDAIAKVPVARENIWFHLRGLDGDDDVEGILTDEHIPEARCFALEHPLAKLVMGKRVGDRFSSPQAIGPDREYEVAELKHKAIWLLHDIMATHADRFPEETSMFTIKMKGNDVSPILDVAKDTSDHARGMLDLYDEHPIPVCVLAPMYRRSVVGMAEHIAGSGKQIRTCHGIGGERVQAEKIVREGEGKGAVLDTLSAWRAMQFGMLPALQQWYGTLYLAQSSFDEFLQMRSESAMSTNHDHGSIGYIDGEYVRTEQSAAESRIMAQKIDEGISLIQEHCEICPVDDEDFSGAELGIVARDAVLLVDPVLLSRAKVATLLSDELNLRQLAQEFGVSRSAWLQTATKVLTENELLTDTQEYSIVAKLAVWRHGHVSLSGQTLAGIAEKGPEPAFGHFQAAARYLGGADADVPSHMLAALSAMELLWSSSLVSHEQGRCAGHIFERLIAGRKDWQAILGAIQQRLSLDATRSIAGQRSFEYFTAWCRGHFLSLG